LLHDQNAFARLQLEIDLIVLAVGWSFSILVALRL